MYTQISTAGFSDIPEPGLQGNVSFKVSISWLSMVGTSSVDVSDLSALRLTLAS